MQKIDPRALEEIEAIKDQKTRQAILDGSLVLYWDENKEIFMVFEQVSVPFIDPGVELQYAYLETNFHTYPTLMDIRAVPTEEDRKLYPAMCCNAVLHSGGEITPGDALRALIMVLTGDMDRDAELPTFSEAFKYVVKGAASFHKANMFLHDRRIKPILESLVSQTRLQGFPATFEEIRQITSMKLRTFYYSLKFYLRRAEVVLSWYTVPTLYILRIESEETSTKWTVLGSDEHKAMLQLAHKYCWDRHDGYLQEIALLANDQVVRIINPRENYDDMSDLEEEYDNLSDEERSAIVS